MKKALLSLLVVLGTVASASAYDFMVDGLAYNINDDGTTVTVTYEQEEQMIGWDDETETNLYTPTYSNLPASLTIPESVSYNGTTYTVTTIGNKAFWACTSLTSVYIPATINSIEYNPFELCHNLVDFTVAEDNAIYDSRDNCHAIMTKVAVTVYIPTIYNGQVFPIPQDYAQDAVVVGSKATVLPSNTKAIGYRAFCNCFYLTSIDIPEGVTLIDKMAFSNCLKLKKVTLPSTITRIGSTAFGTCQQLTDIYAYFNPADVTLENRFVWQELPHFEYTVYLHTYPQYVQWYEDQVDDGNNPWIWDGHRFNVIGDLGVGLYLIGTFNSWSHETRVPLTVNNGKWTVNQAMDAGAEFKLIKIVEGQQGMTWIGGSGAQITQEQVENQEEIDLFLGYGSNFKIPVAGNWTFTVDLTTNKMVISGVWNEQVIDPAMYIIGSFNEWDQNTQEAMTAGENNTWTITKTLDAGVRFKFRDELGTWYGGQDNNGVNYFEITKDIVTGSTPITLVDGADFMIPVAGTWTFTITRGETMTLVISGEWVDPLPEPTEVYIMGEVNGNNWGANTGVQMATEDHVTFTSDVTCGPTTELDEDGFAYFSFTTKLDANNDWNVIAPYRFGAESPDLLVSEEMFGTELNLQAGGNAFKLADGEYNLSLNLETMKLIITKKAADLKVGDVTGDGEVDIADVNAIINIILKKKTQDDYPGNANLNGDDDIDISDVNAVINIILGKTTPAE